MGYIPTRFNISVNPSSQIDDWKYGYAKLSILRVYPEDGISLPDSVYSSNNIFQGFMFGECIVTKPLYFLTFEIRISIR